MCRSLFQDKAADNSRYAERGWINNGSQEEGEEESNQEESDQKEVVFIGSPPSGARRGYSSPRRIFSSLFN
jgi:hypothetical protein